MKKYAKKITKVIFSCCSNENAKDYAELLQDINGYGVNDISFKEDAFKKAFDGKYSSANFSLMLATDVSTFSNIIKEIPIKVLDHIIDNKREVVDRVFLKKSIEINGMAVVNLKNVDMLEKLIKGKSKADRKAEVCDEMIKFMKRFKYKCFKKGGKKSLKYKI